ncbi:MAG: hypothetical protein GX974_05930 [Clostridiales bacterium]|nr:hypothetical protein [Clostridiales bacterium]
MVKITTKVKDLLDTSSYLHNLFKMKGKSLKSDTGWELTKIKELLIKTIEDFKDEGIPEKNIWKIAKELARDFGTTLEELENIEPTFKELKNDTINISVENQKEEFSILPKHQVNSILDKLDKHLVYNSTLEVAIQNKLNGIAYTYIDLLNGEIVTTWKDYAINEDVPFEVVLCSIRTPINNIKENNQKLGTNNSVSDICLRSDIEYQVEILYDVLKFENMVK